MWTQMENKKCRCPGRSFQSVSIDPLGSVKKSHTHKKTETDTSSWVLLVWVEFRWPRSIYVFPVVLITLTLIDWYLHAITPPTIKTVQSYCKSCFNIHAVKYLCETYVKRLELIKMESKLNGNKKIPTFCNLKFVVNQIWNIETVAKLSSLKTGKNRHHILKEAGSHRAQISFILSSRMF